MNFGKIGRFFILQIIIITIFAIVYELLEKWKPNLHFKGLHYDTATFLDYLYFSVTTQTTVGYGDIVPNSLFTRIITMVQMLMSYIVLVVTDVVGSGVFSLKDI